MRQPKNSRWWLLVALALFAVFAWPPSGDRSLAVKLVNWAVDPRDELPTLPDPFGLGIGDDPDAVSLHDQQTQQYDAIYSKGGWTRRRLQLKDARDPFNPSTERQVLTGLAVIIAFLAWRWGARKGQE
jgi:hypothetical protein